jgi:hypothetical protein
MSMPATPRPTLTLLRTDETRRIARTIAKLPTLLKRSDYAKARELGWIQQGRTTDGNNAQVRVPGIP